MRPSLPRNALLVAVALAAAGALGLVGVAHLRAAPPAGPTIATEPAQGAPSPAVAPSSGQYVFSGTPSPSSFPAPPGAPPPLASPPPVPAPNLDSDPALDPDSDSADPDPDHPPAPPAPITLEEYLQHGSKEPLVPPVIQVEAKLAPGSVPTSEPLVPPVITVTATPIDAPSDSVAAAALLVPPVVNVAPPADPR